MPDTPSVTTQQFLRGLRLATVVISVVVLAGTSMFRNLPRYQPGWLQVLAYLILVGVVLVEVVLIRRGQTWGALRWPALLAVLVASLAAITSLPPDTAVTSTDWAFGTVGWMYLILLLDRPLVQLLAALTLHEGVTVAGLLLSGSPDHDAWLNLVVGSIGALGYPAATAIAATALRAVAASAEQATRQSEEMRTAEEIAIHLHHHRQAKFAALHESALPLLVGLADGALNPADPQIQRRCAIEAARMRRLFAEADSVPDTLIHALRHCADAATQRGIVVDLDSKGDWPDPPTTVQRALTDAPIAALATARSHARITVVGADGTLAVSVRADCGPIELPGNPPSDVTLANETDDDDTWVEALWTPTTPSQQ